MLACYASTYAEVKHDVMTSARREGDGEFERRKKEREARHSQRFPHSGQGRETTELGDFKMGSLESYALG